MRQAMGYAWMYDRMATSAKRWGDALSILSGVLGGIVGTASLVSIATDASMPLWSRIITAIVGYAVGVIAILMATWRLSETQMNGVLTQVSFATMGRDLLYQLAQPRRDRADAREYMKAKLSEIEQLKVSAPIIDATARKAYNRKFKNNPIYSPDDQWDTTLAEAAAAQAALRGRPRGYDSGGSSDPSLPSQGSDEASGSSASDAAFSSEDSELFDRPVAARDAPDPLAVMDTLVAAFDAARRQPVANDPQDDPQGSDGH